MANIFVLRYFLAVCEEGNLTRAAERLSISRQALSKAIMVLEGELGTPLLKRSRTGVERTEAGEILCRYSRKICQDWERVNREIEELRRGQQAELRVGYGQMVYNLWPADHVEQFSEAHPNIHLTCRIQLPDQLFGELDAGRLDLIVTSVCEGTERYYATRLSQAPLRVILSKSDPLAGRERVALEELKDHVILTLMENAAAYQRVRRAFSERGLSPIITTSRSTDPFTILRSVREGGLAYFSSFIPMFYQQSMEGLTALAVDGPEWFAFRDVYALALEETPAAQAYISYLAARCSCEKRPDVVG